VEGVATAEHARADRAAERTRTADEILTLSDEVRRRDAALAVVLDRLAASVRERRHDQVRGYAGAIDPRTLAELLVARFSLLWGLLEVARSVLVFSPIAVTWYALSTASDAYERLVSTRPDLVSRPFLLLWQEGFANTPGVLRFSTLAIIDASLIGLLIALSLLIHFRAEIRDVALRTRVLLKESEIRGLIGHAESLSAGDLDGAVSEELVDQMVAEERRVYERALEREQRLFDLETAITDLRRAAADLAAAASDIRGVR